LFSVWWYTAGTCNFRLHTTVLKFPLLKTCTFNFIRYLLGFYIKVSCYTWSITNFNWPRAHHGHVPKSAYYKEKVRGTFEQPYSYKHPARVAPSPFLLWSWSAERDKSKQPQIQSERDLVGECRTILPIFFFSGLITCRPFDPLASPPPTSPPLCKNWNSNLRPKFYPTTTYYLVWYSQFSNQVKYALKKTF
jgi:hypothetical protein